MCDVCLKEDNNYYENMMNFLGLQIYFQYVVLNVQEVLTNIYSKLLYKIGQEFLDIQNRKFREKNDFKRQYL